MRYNSKVKNTNNKPTFKKYTTIAFVAEAIFAIVCMVGWYSHLDNAVGMMNCDAMAFIGTIAVYGGKSGFEHSQWATPIVTGIASGLTSGDPVTGLQNAINTYQSQEQMEQMNCSTESVSSSIPNTNDANTITENDKFKQPDPTINK